MKRKEIKKKKEKSCVVYMHLTPKMNVDLVLQTCANKMKI